MYLKKSICALTAAYGTYSALVIGVLCYVLDGKMRVITGVAASGGAPMHVLIRSVFIDGIRTGLISAYHAASVIHRIFVLSVILSSGIAASAGVRIPMSVFIGFPLVAVILMYVRLFATGNKNERKHNYT